MTSGGTRKHFEVFFHRDQSMARLVYIIFLAWMAQAEKRSFDVAPCYLLEDHSVTTPDGFILELFRMPGSRFSPATEHKTVVFLMHGILCSSSEGIIKCRGVTQVYLLADGGDFAVNVFKWD